MIVNPIEIEGTWEQIAVQAAKYPGHKMRLTVLPDLAGEAQTSPDTRSLEEKMRDILARVPKDEWDNLPIDMGDNLDHYIYGTPKLK